MYHKKNCECVVMVNNLFQRFFSIHIPANKYVGLDFYLSFFFFTFELILISAQYADCRDGGFSIYCKGPPK